MWRLLYLFLLFVRVYFALSPSYLHPDEVFQGPEPIAGMAQCKSRRCSRLLTFVCRIPLSIPESSNVGMDCVPAHPQRLPSMANLWLADDLIEVDMGSR